ncbi:TetR family transcriptional regulator [Nocardioides sp. Leaf307]|uniref:TetR family transcriptional regulator n=1 Tax=Nocardioides sp. Leaf307 TaxID=1736331 RepID=UPI000702DED6|nr:TetR family transcriptional regulator [Nocardioides sp. Leaf307]KQQ43981.1 hypothetical protein ASF50_09110 [Nocardioides sp. Leaf307]
MGLREDKKQAAWQEIRGAAWRLFAERGFDAVSVEEIAGAAGVSRSTFFNYFRTKEAVVVDPAPRVVRRLDDLLAAQPVEREAWEALTAVLVGLTRADRDDMVARRRLVADSPELQRGVHELGEQLAAQLVAWMTTRLPHDPIGAALVVELSLAATRTAWAAWPEDAGVDAYLALLQDCLGRARPAAYGHGRPEAH